MRLVALCLALSAAWVFAAVAQSTSSTSTNAAFVSQWREQIKGKEKQPAGEVFANVQFLRAVPAATFLLIMDVGYSRGLGVGCAHCHDEQNFASDDKRAKRAAREMQVMHRTFNDSLRKMANATTPSDERSISCSTCHRGQAVPPRQ